MHFRQALFFVCVSVFAFGFAACSKDTTKTSPMDDAGTGGGTRDAYVTPHDAGPRNDAALIRNDAGPVTLPDASVGSVDSGTIAVDATAMAMDAGADAGNDGGNDAGADAGPTSCVQNIFGSYFLRFDGTLVHYGPNMPVVDAATSMPLRNVVELVDFQTHSCARKSDNTVWCWAKVTATPLYGGLGNGDLVGTPATAYAATRVLISGGASPTYLDNVIAIQRNQGLFYAAPVCAIRTDHTLWCWGPKTDGNIMQTGTDMAYATQIHSDATHMLMGVDQVTVGQRHACVLQSGVVSCWGANIRGEIGQGDTVARVYPLPVMGQPASVTAVAGGEDANCLLAGGEVYCWGSSGGGQIGIGSPTFSICNSNYCQLTPSVAAEPSAGMPLTNVSEIFMGYLWMCATKTDRTVWCWGAYGSSSYALRPQPLVVGGVTLSNLVALTSFGANGFDSTQYLTSSYQYYTGTYNATMSACM